MRHSALFPLVLFFVFLLGIYDSSLAISYTWNANAINTTWGEPLNWTPQGVPSNADQVTIGACSICPILTSDITIQSLIFPQNNASKLSIENKILTVTNLNLWGGEINSNGGKIIVTNISDIRYIHFRGLKIDIEITANGSGRIHGGNTYHGDVHYKSAIGFIIGYAFVETYLGEATFTANGSGWLNIGFFPNITFSKKVIFNTSGTAGIQVGRRGYVTYMDEVICNNNSNSQIVFSPETGTSEFRKAVILNHGASAFGTQFGSTGGGKSIFTETATLQSGTLIGGRIFLAKVEHRNATTLTSINGSNGIDIGTGSSFAGPVSFKSAHVTLRGAIFSKQATLERTSASPNTNNLGGNTFHGTTTLINSGGGNWFFGQNDPDIFNGDLIVQHSGGNGTYLAHWTAGHKFRGNLTLTLAAGATGIIQLGGAGGTSEQTTDSGNRTLTVNASSGNIRIGGFTQRGPNAPVFSLNTPPSTASLTLSGASLFEAPVSVSVPQLFLNGATFNQASSFTKTGSGSNNSTGGNVFKSKVTIRNMAASGVINSALNSDDIINQ